MNIFKTLAASAVIALSLVGGAMAADTNSCMSSDDVWQANQKQAQAKGLTLDHVTLNGADAKRAHDYLAKKFQGSKVLDFDEITFITNKLDNTSPVLMIIYSDGCVVAGAPIGPDEFIEMVKAVTGDTKAL